MAAAAGVSELLLSCHCSHHGANKVYSALDVDIDSFGEDV